VSRLWIVSVTAKMRFGLVTAQSIAAGFLLAGDTVATCSGRFEPVPGSWLTPVEASGCDLDGLGAKLGVAFGDERALPSSGFDGAAREPNVTRARHAYALRARAQQCLRRR
jgi:hypothetical protein